MSRSALAAARTHLDNKFGHGPIAFPAVYAGFASLAAALCVLEGADAATPPFAPSELELDVELWDASFLASLAVAGGAVWEDPERGREERRSYWEWFLTLVVTIARERPLANVSEDI